jgi:hypothetical protein
MSRCLSFVGEQPTLRRPFFGGCRATPLVVFPREGEGGGAPQGAGADRRTPWPALRSGRSLQRKGPPAQGTSTPYRGPARLSALHRGICRGGMTASSAPGRASGDEASPACPSPASSSRKRRSALRAEPRNRPVRKPSVDLRPRGPHRPGSAAGRMGLSASPAPDGRFGVSASPLPSLRFVPLWLASRKRPSADEAVIGI